MQPVVTLLERVAGAPTLLVATDFDGVLAPFEADPMDAAPLPGTIDTLRALAALPHVHVAVVSGLDLDTRRYFEIGDRDDLSYEEKLAAYRRLTDDYFETDRYRDFCASRLPHIDELVLEWVDSPDFDDLLVQTVRSTYPEAEHERFIGHLRGLLGQWVREQA